MAIIIAFVTSLLLWCFGPLISIGHFVPFQSIVGRLLMQLVIIIAALVPYYLAVFHEVGGDYRLAITSLFANIKGHFNTIYQKLLTYIDRCQFKRKLTFKRDEAGKRFKKTPCYLVMGSPKSGKSQLLMNNSMVRVSPEFYGKEAVALSKGSDTASWHFFNEAIFVEQALLEDSGDPVDAKRYIKLLKKRQKRKPINGVVLTFSMTELLLAKHEDRRSFVAHFIAQIKMINQMLKVVVPVYVMLTKADLVSGFTEFFSDMSKEDLAQVWGVSFPLDNQHTVKDLIHTFDKEYAQMMARLSQRVLWTLDVEKNQQAREMIYRFPQQMQLFRKPVAALVEEIFSSQLDNTILNLRGIYFTSSEQKGEPYNFFLHIIGKRYNLTSSHQHEQEHHNENYFSDKVFSQVMLPESRVFGLTRRQSKLRTFAYRSIFILAPAVFIATTLAFNSAYHSTIANIDFVANQVATYHLALDKLSPSDDHIADTLPALDALHHAVNYSSATGMHQLLFVAHSLTHASNQALDRSLHSLFLPRVAANLEATMNQGGLSTNTLYASLKGYLAFSPSHYTNADAIRAPMEIIIADQYPKPEMQASLRYYLNRSADLSIDRLPLDKVLTNKVRLALQQVVPSQRAYALLTIKALASNLPAINLPSVIGQGYTEVFSDQPKIVDALYTKKGYEQVYSNNYQSIAEQVANDNKDIGLHAEHDNTQSLDSIVAEVQKDYGNNYLSAWQSTLASIHIQNFTSYADAITKIKVLSGNNSPMTKLLAIVNDNTASVDGNGVDIANHYHDFNNFSQSSITSSQWQSARKQLQLLVNYLTAIKQSSDVDAASFKAAKQYMQQQNNPLYRFSIIANQAPKPLQQWLQSIANNVWQLINQHAMSYINSQYQAQVLSEYADHIRGRYPLHQTANNEVSISAFTHFFKQSGTLSRFFSQYIKPFINTDKQIWQLYSPAGHHLGFSHHDLDAFKRMQRIQDLYFDAESKQLSLHFAIKPINLDPRAKNIILTVGDKQMIYAHGPQRPMNLSWPLDVDNQATKLVITSFSDRRNVFSAEGSWSVFKVFSNHSMTENAHSSGYLFHVHMGNHDASYEIISDAPLAAFHLAGINGFTLPQQL